MEKSFKILSFFNFLKESQTGLDSAKTKKRNAAMRAQELQNRVTKNQAKYEYYDKKEEYEKKKIQLANDIKAEDDNIQKEKLRAELNKLEEEWKIEQAKFKNELKVM